MNLFSALADPTRRAIIELLSQRGPLSAHQIGENFAISAPAVSQHLKILREAGLVRVQKRAQQRIYAINAEAVRELETWARRTTDLWEQRFDALEKLLAAEKAQSNPGGHGGTQGDTV